MEKDAAHFAEKLGKRIRELREKKALTQDRAVGSAGITGKYWAEVQRGSVAVSVVVLDKIASALGVSVADIMNMEHWSSRQELLEKLEICLREADEPTLRLYLRLLRTLQL